MKVYCPNCGEELEPEEFPCCPSSSFEYECSCGCVFEYGWIACGEARSIVSKPGDDE